MASRQAFRMFSFTLSWVFVGQDTLCLYIYAVSIYAYTCIYALFLVGNRLGSYEAEFLVCKTVASLQNLR